MNEQKERNSNLENIENNNQTSIDNEIKKDLKFKRKEEELQYILSKDKKLLGQDLASEEKDVIDCFEKSRMLLQRIYIIYNQTRNTVGVELISEKKIREILENLKNKGYITIEKFNYEGEEKEAFILTESGKQLLK